ncbi:MULTISPECIES: acyltransferase family protein [Olivibacter]|uniref:Acyltransferase family protein n=1 Tax=Olivibacter jilunii TaxID=985016 RepID=A0ABW6B3D1_9SPHI
MNKFLSEKLVVISFISILLVVFLHAYGPDVTLKSNSGSLGFFYLLQLFLSQVIARIAVPSFFFVSGYLFFINYYPNKRSYIDKLRKRVKSIVLPYLLWSVFSFAIFYVLQSLPPFSRFFSKDLLTSYSLEQIVGRIILRPIAYQLWFLKDLFLLCIISPALYFLTKKSYGIWIVILAFFWSLNYSFFYIVRIESLLFFSSGSLFAIYFKHVLVKTNDNSLFTKSILLIWIILSGLNSYFIGAGTSNEGITLLYKLGIIVGMLSLWNLYDLLYAKNLIKQFSFFSNSFFIYVFHEPVLTMIKKGLMSVFGVTSISKFCVYLIAPVSTIVIGVFLAFFIKKKYPKVYGFITGGR